MLDYVIANKLDADREADFAEMGRLAHAESVFKDFVGYDQKKLLGVARKYAEEGDHFLAIAMDGDRSVGVLAGHISDYYFSSDRLARDVLWYVREEYRNTGAGLVLLDMFERWSKARGAAVVYLSQDSGINIDKFTRMMEKRGYAFVGANYSLGVS